jgi:hypothetical protein
VPNAAVPMTSKKSLDSILAFERAFAYL